MSLTYSQKKYIQKYYLTYSIEKLSQKLSISKNVVAQHINRHPHLFESVKEDNKVCIPFYHPSEHIAYFAVLLLLIVVVYANGMFADFVSDDIYAIVRSENLLKSFDYFFITPTFFARTIQYFIAYHIAGLMPFFYRIFNIAFHVGFVWMAYLIALYFLRRRMTAFVAASLAAVHPMMIESVTWISGGIYAQAGFFTLLAFYLYLVYGRVNKYRFLVVSLLSFLIALSVSEKVIVFPFIILLYEHIFGSWRNNWKRVGSFFSLSILWGFMLLGRVVDRLDYLQTSQGLESSYQFTNPLLQIPIALGTYLKLFIWPHHLTLYQSEFQLGGGTFILYLIISLVFIGLVIWNYFKHKTVFFWLSFFIIMLLPTLNPFGLSWIVAERYAYLGSVGLYIFFAVILQKIISSKKYQVVGYILLSAILIGLSIRTIVRNIDWKTQDNLWIATGKTSPSDPKTHNNLGDVYSRQGDLQRAAEEFGRAIQLNPNYADAYHNLGNVYQKVGSPSAALQLYAKAYEINPNLWQSLQQIAIIYFQNKEYDKAISYMQQAIKVSPRNVSLYVNMGAMHAQMGNIKKARALFNTALELDPGNEVVTQALRQLLL